jgi:hypothetical protein
VNAIGAPTRHAVLTMANDAILTERSVAESADVEAR